MTSDHRPITSKARGICKYYATERGCFNANSCKFLHSTEPAIDPSGSRPPLLTPYDQSKRCKYYAQGEQKSYCKRGDKCWFIHEKGMAGTNAEDGDDDCCSICFEKPSIYGLLGGCNHIFCIDCIRKWRDPSGKGPDTSNLKKCPMCRAQCRYIIPASRFVKDGLEKERVIQNYKDSMARIPCQHFVTTKAKNAENPLCPYGADCFYQHLNDDGTAYIFPYGAEFALREWTRRNRSRTRHPFGIPDGLETIFGDETGLAGNFVMEMLGMLRQVVMGSSMEEGGVNAGRGPRPRRRGPGGGSDPTRTDFLSALHTVRAALYGDGDDDDNIRPVIFPEAIASPNSDLRRDSGDNGSVLIEFDTGIVENAIMDPELSRDTESSVPPLEPIDIPRQETPSLPSEPIHTEGAAEDDDEMPALQSVSDSSDSEGDNGGSNDDERDSHFHYDSSDDLPLLERIQPDEEASSFSRRFSTVVERGRESSEDCETMDEQAEASCAPPSVVRDLEGFETSQDVATVSPPQLEPPFVTDGRGRVVWSNKDSTETTAPPDTREETREDAQSPSSAARLFEWMTGFF